MTPIKPTEEDLERAQKLVLAWNQEKEQPFTFPSLNKMIAQALAEERMRTFERSNILVNVIDYAIRSLGNQVGRFEIDAIRAMLRSKVEEYRAAIGDEIK